MTRGDRARKRDQHQRADDEMEAPAEAVGMLRQVVRIELAKTRVHAKTVTDRRPYSAMPLSQGQGRVQRVMQYSFQNLGTSLTSESSAVACSEVLSHFGDAPALPLFRRCRCGECRRCPRPSQ